MSDNYVNYLAGRQAANTMQTQMRNTFPSEKDSNIDNTLAKKIDSFLSGTSNSLPSLKSLLKLNDKQLDGSIISVGFWYVISEDFSRSENGSYIRIEKESPLKDASRFDIITAYSYEAYILYEFSGTIKTLDPTQRQSRIFNPKRVAFLQEYLQKYQDYKKEESIRTSKKR